MSGKKEVLSMSGKKEITAGDIEPKTLTGAEILGAVESPVVERVNVPEWKGAVHVRLLNASERDQFDAAIRDDDGKFEPANYRAKLVAACLCDENGKALVKIGDAEKIGRKGSVAIDRIFVVAHRLNRMGREAIEAEKKDSAADPPASSP